MRPLDGIRVLDLSRVLSGPFAGRMLSDLGADVVKVEPPEGDVTRRWGQVRHGLSGFYTAQNAGKRSVAIDLKAEGGPALVARLAAVADVVIENFRPGVLDRLGLGWDVLAAANPALIMLSITGFGQVGPDRDRPAYAAVLHAESGLVARQDGLDPALSVADTVAGLHGLVAVLAALRQRDQHGTGQHIDMGMLDALLVTDDLIHQWLDDAPTPRVELDTFEAVGGPLLIVADLRYTWHQLSTRFGLSTTTPTGAPLADKIADRRAAVAEWVALFDDRRALTDALGSVSLAWADVRTPTDALDAPSVSARGIVAEVDDRGGGVRRVVQSPYRFSAAEAGVAGPAAHLGEHDAEVLGEWLDLGPDDVAALRAAAVLP